MIATGLTIFVGYFFYYFSGGPDFGARYWFPVIVPLVALSARGLEVIERLAGSRVLIGVTALILLSLSIYLPWRGDDKYYQYRGMRPDLGRLAKQAGIGPDLVLVAGQRFPDYASAAVLNPVDLRSRATIYAWDRSPEVRREVLAAYSDRRVWLVEGPSITRSGFRIVAGPLAASDLRGAPGRP
jgi:hypothetical protein